MTRHRKGHLIEKRLAFIAQHLELAERAYPGGEPVSHGWSTPAGQAWVIALREGIPYSKTTSSQDIYWTNHFHYKELLKHPELAGKLPQRESSAQARFFRFVDEVQLILHPNLVTGLVRTAHEMREELRQATIKETVEDNDLLLMRERFLPILQRYRQSFQHLGTGPGPRMYLRELLREIIDAYGPPV